MTEEHDPGIPPEQQDARIVVVMKGDSPVPMYVDFVKVTPFHMIAIGEWLSLKGRQLIAMAEQQEITQQKRPQIAVPSMSEEMIQEILGVDKK